MCQHLLEAPGHPTPPPAIRRRSPNERPPPCFESESQAITTSREAETTRPAESDAALRNLDQSNAALRNLDRVHLVLAPQQP